MRSRNFGEGSVRKVEGSGGVTRRMNPPRAFLLTNPSPAPQLGCRDPKKQKGRKASSSRSPDFRLKVFTAWTPNLPNERGQPQKCASKKGRKKGPVGEKAFQKDSQQYKNRWPYSKVSYYQRKACGPEEKGRKREGRGVKPTWSEATRPMPGDRLCSQGFRVPVQ